MPVPGLYHDRHPMSSSFLRLYCSVGMTLATMVECWSLLVHAMYTGLAGCRALIFKSSLSALAFTTCLHNIFWVRASRAPSTELPARSGGQLSGVSICVGSRWLPSSANCWHVAQFTSNASPILVCRDKRGSIPTSEPPVARLILSIRVAGKSGMLAGAGLLVPWFLASAFPRPRQTQSITQATLPTGHFDVASVRPRPPSLLGILSLSFASSHASLPRWAVPSVGHSSPCPMSIATALSIFASNRMKVGRVYAVASIPLPR